MNARFLLMLLVAFLFYNCSKEVLQEDLPSPTEATLDEQNIVKLKFPQLNSLKADVSAKGNSVNLFFEVDAILQNVNGKWELKSDKLTEIEVINSVTGEKTYGYVYNEKKRSLKAAVIPQEPGGDEWGIFTGLYGFNGLCFIWGTLIVGQNGESIFIPADYTTQLLLNVCPEPGSLFAETPEVDLDGI